MNAGGMCCVSGLLLWTYCTLTQRSRFQTIFLVYDANIPSATSTHTEIHHHSTRLTKQSYCVVWQLPLTSSVGWWWWWEGGRGGTWFGLRRLLAGGLCTLHARPCRCFIGTTGMTRQDEHAGLDNINMQYNVHTHTQTVLGGQDTKGTCLHLHSSGEP